MPPPLHYVAGGADCRRKIAADAIGKPPGHRLPRAQGGTKPGRQPCAIGEAQRLRGQRTRVPPSSASPSSIEKSVHAMLKHQQQRRHW